MIRLAQLFASENNTVFSYGQEAYFLKQKKEELERYLNIKLCKTLDECIQSSNTIISGMPISKDNITINSPYSEEIIRLDFLNKKLKNKFFIAGAIPKWFMENLENVGLEEKENENKVIELLDSEPLNILNAIPTVEGTIKIAIETTEETIHESNILILGYGRIGKILCNRFASLGANIYCAARKESDLAWIRESRYIPIKYNEISDISKKIDIIINTVPTVVINEKILKSLNQKSFIIDLASLPGGVDKRVAEMYKIRVITALGIPGKIAPNTAAKYIKNVIEKII